MKSCPQLDPKAQPPRKLSVLTEDPEEIKWLGLVDVWLNGRLLTDSCRSYDVDKGEVEVYSKDDEGSLVPDSSGERYETKILTGLVQVYRNNN